jgi:hypothetical protein
VPKIDVLLLVVKASVLKDQRLGEAFGFGENPGLGGEMGGSKDLTVHGQILQESAESALLMGWGNMGWAKGNERVLGSRDLGS